MKFYYAYYSSHDNKTYIISEYLNPYLMSSDYLLFDSAEECRKYWEEKGVKIDRYAV